LYFELGPGLIKRPGPLVISILQIATDYLDRPPAGKKSIPVMADSQELSRFFRRHIDVRLLDEPD
jgi:hypothetical protein